MYQPTLEGTGTPETRTAQRPRPSKPLPFTLRIAESPAPVAGAPVLLSSAEAADFIRPKIGAADREAFVILHMDVKNQVLDVELHGLGDVDSSAVYPRQVFRSALLRNAASLIFCHNHPTGDPAPSLCDRQLTRDLVLGAHAVGVKVLDHIIVGRTDAYFSFADQGILNDYALTATATLGQVREDRTDYGATVRPCRLDPSELCSDCRTCETTTPDPADPGPFNIFDPPQIEGVELRRLLTDDQPEPPTTDDNDPDPAGD